MKILIGRFFRTLSSQVNKEIKESIYKNKAFLNSQWSFLEKGVFRWSTYYKMYIFQALVLAALVTCNLIFWQPWVKPYVIQHAPFWRELLEWQGVFLGGQLTIIGVVYPLVVGLISVLFQNKSAKKVIFPLYQKYSGFMFAGLSGLTLSVFIVFGYFLRSTISEHAYVAICLTSALWFSSNLLLTAWFFVKTFRMLDESSREAIIFRYSLHEACELDVRNRIKGVLIENSVCNKLIDNPDENVMEVLSYSYFNDGYKDITRKVKRERSLKDVRLWLLNSAIRVQLNILKLKKIKGAKLVVQPMRGSVTGDTMILALYDGFKINPLVKALIKLSFSFEKEFPRVGIGLSSVLNAVIGPANDAIRDGDAREFSDALESLALWHTELAEALSFKNGEGNLDNWLVLPASGFLSRSYLDELMGEYYRLAQETVERIPDNSRFYTDMLYFHKRIFSSRDALIEQEMRSLIQGSYYMWYMLVEWRSYNSESSDLRIASKYEDILYDFVGAWESWIMYIEPISRRTWDFNKSYPAYITHLEFTASTAISALRFGNFEAAGWGVDMLLNWLDKLSHDEHWNAEFGWHSVLINHYFLALEPTSDIWQLILRGDDYDYSAASALSFKNAHVDLRVITACYMLLKPGNEQPDLLAKYVNALLSGARIHPSSSGVQRPYVISNAGNLLGAYIRHRDYGQHTYGTWISTILESFGRIYKERRVSGRIYTGWGASSPQSMKRAYVEIAISMSKSIWKLPNDWNEAIFSGYFRHMDQKALISDLNDWIKIANEDCDYLLVDPDSLETLKANFIESVEGIITSISNVQSQLVVDAEIDTERLASFGVASSAILSDKNEPEFPLVLFEHIELGVDLDDNFSFDVNISDYAKERVALGIDTNRPINEETWMLDCVSNNLKENILMSLLEYPKFASYYYTDKDCLLSDIQRTSKSMACPVLFVGDRELKSMLRKSSYELEIADRHNISRQDGFDNEYICHVGNCEVYSLNYSDVGYSLLTSKELFHKVCFRKIADDQYVDVDFKLNNGSDTVGKLTFKYWMKVTFTENTPCLKFELVTKDGEKV
ncbi:hypothetical protein [Pseudoalteromonas sp. OOF1S-7]|uniref:hypothetical protein n=1 Tax=Pseudoalteromonas sp. OOF1S-7 TaxID=2917757 RepID=UPI001EF6C051|nr:hypothetical protein [Pseudoalteromonas sp. OOF1S-7]MCG7537402.1 hypothetical protein [Pseudoalteromonas sp. OOF1S-7]